MKKIDLKTIKYPKYFIKNEEETYKENVKRLKMQKFTEAQIDEMVDKPDFEPIKIGWTNLLSAVSQQSEKAKTWEQRKILSKVIEKLYDAEENDGVLDLSDEQFDYVFNILVGDLTKPGTAITYITEEFERIKIGGKDKDSDKKDEKKPEDKPETKKE